MRDLRAELIREYSVEDVNLIVQNGSTLGVTLTNSSFNDLSTEAKESKAIEIARFANKRYASMEEIDRVWVSFAVNANYVVLQYRNTMDTYFFDKRELDSTAAPIEHPADSARTE